MQRTHGREGSSTKKLPTLERDTALDGAKNFFAIEDKFGAIQSGNDPPTSQVHGALAELSLSVMLKASRFPTPRTRSLQERRSIAKLMTTSPDSATRDWRACEMMLKAAQTDEAKSYATI